MALRPGKRFRVEGVRRSTMTAVRVLKCPSKCCDAAAINEEASHQMDGSWLSTAKRLASLVTALNVLVASAFSIIGIVSPLLILPAADSANHASFIFALYAAARTIPLALFALAAIRSQEPLALLILGGLAGVVQLLDAAIGIVQGDIAKTVAPLAIAALQFGSLYFLQRTISRESPQLMPQILEVEGVAPNEQE
jgi:hypothetical protein